MEAFLVSVGVVALAEIGDKTQILALLLATRFVRPVPVIAGIFAATLLNHALAGLVGTYAMSTFDGPWMRWILGGSFLAMAIWALIPDKLNQGGLTVAERYGAFPATLIAFFLIEMGDKTQIATIALAAKYQALLAVVAGTTVGMMLANVPVVVLCGATAKYLPLRLIRGIAAAVFAVLGILVLIGADTRI